MIYYKYIASYTNGLDSTSTILVTRSCEEVDYANHLIETKNIVKQVIKASIGAIPEITETIELITGEQYNDTVNGSDDLGLNSEIQI